MLALRSQKNPPTPFSILFNSESPKNPARILWPEVSVTASGLMPAAAGEDMSQSQQPLTPELDQSPQAEELGSGRKRGESKETPWLRL